MEGQIFEHMNIAFGAGFFRGTDMWVGLSAFSGVGFLGFVKCSAFEIHQDMSPI